MTVDTGTAPPGTDPTTPTVRRRRASRWVLLGVLGVVLVAAVCGVLLVRDALAARTALTRAAAQVPAVSEELRAGVRPEADGSAPARLAASPALAELRLQTTIARESTDGPLWWLAARTPVIGPSAGAAADVAVVLDDVTDDVLPALADLADAVAATSRAPDGGLDLAPLRAAAPGMAAAQQSITASRARLDAVDPDALVPQLAQPVATLRDRVDELAGAVATGDRAAALGPAMLGADGPRTYLMLSMSTAELRQGGGIPGAIILLRVDGGRVEVVRQVAASEVGPFRAPVLPLSADDEAAYTGRLGMFVQDVTATPDFPTSAALAAAMWARAQGEEVDGVLATDPVALGGLLAATGPVQVPVSPQVARALGRDTVELTAENAVDVLLRRVYDVLDPDTADVFFAEAAAAVLARATADDVSPAVLLAGLQHGAGEHRVRVWSADPAEQARLTGTLIAGSFAAPRAADALGVFLTDHVAGKMSAYLDSSLRVVGTECTDAGRVATLELTLASTAPADAATALPSYVAGVPGGASPPGTLRLGVTVSGPRDGATPRVERDGTAVGGEARTTHGRATQSVTVVLRPGEDTTLRLTVPAGPGSGPGAGGTPSGRLEVWSTPTTTAGGLLDVEAPVCG
ncbi:DUF4012 domain-containing protein [Krasilnikoviella flava]|uniref:DUF4012 domain-containing protein n=1 Tax=Krasilnikoviella flava TaxID=526729 RepID=A0A1T5IM43_9MICO|nr:DUF4012 domain-containing protein [Krasilnikoviella flava]SKC40205.1 Protein of unknown function [Krasilnikoviella flava]